MSFRECIVLCISEWRVVRIHCCMIISDIFSSKFLSAVRALVLLRKHSHGCESGGAGIALGRCVRKGVTGSQHG